MLKEKGLIQELYRHLILYKSASRDELRYLAKKFGFDYSTADRKLRKLTELGFIRPSKGTKGFNDRYYIEEPKNAPEAQICPNSMKNFRSSEEEMYLLCLNEKLKEIKKKYRPKFGDDIKKIFVEIDGAINSKYEYVKIWTINKNK